uniref:Hg(II)-responsive transcriptional regulator n=1 Tax=Hydrogenovibrio crunogenus TaxID=39765 RepID=UPI001092CF54|nr:Hg(II)-responsive transcriptional regulator [Hydrogenovibrio crunogenus]
MEDDSKNLTIGGLAKQSGVGVETIRFYQRKKLLVEPVKPYGGIRRYGLTDVKRVKFIKSAQRLGFSLKEISSLLALEDGSHCSEAKDIAQLKLNSIREKIADLTRLERILDQYTKECTISEDSNISCPLISKLFND